MDLSSIEKKGYCRVKLALSENIKESVLKQNWGQLDHLCAALIQGKGELFQLLFPLASQSRIEFIISVRDAQNEWEEDGIWHDDGSRILAFSMGLNLSPKNIKGGELLLRQKGSQHIETIAPMEFGEVVIFKTGVENYEHKVLKVEQGLRVVMAGWCYR